MKSKRNFTLLTLALVFATLSLHFHINAIIDLYVRTPTLSSCLKNDFTLVQGSRFSVCRIWQDGEGEYVHAYIYDETDELAKPHFERSASWRRAVRTYTHGKPFSIFNKMECESVHVIGHIYRADFDYSLLPII
jgi:hypothetical protein